MKTERPALIVASNLYTAVRYAKLHRLERPLIVVDPIGFKGVSLADYTVHVLYDERLNPQTMSALRLMQTYP